MSNHTRCQRTIRRRKFFLSKKAVMKRKKPTRPKCPAAIDLVGSLVNQPTGYYGVLFS